ncbi:MAG: hypothetical protein CM1200mP23_1600 [Nitrososphaerota archaeon]|nr:MAG: hypothetical protein CM1200mP23_1600 [Nitrososphaerota archaeon]
MDLKNWIVEKIEKKGRVITKQSMQKLDRLALKYYQSFLKKNHV